LINSSRHHLELFVREAAAEILPGSRILDAGAGDCRYSVFFAKQGYESADFAQASKAYGALTYICDLTKIPVEDGRYDAVLCTQVLGHLRDPKAALMELRRVLKPGGQLWLTAQFSFQENEQPHDYFRYTRYGLDHLLTGAGFQIKRLEWLEGYLGTLAYQLGVAARSLRFRPADFGGGLSGIAAAALATFSRPLFALLSLVFSSCDQRHKLVGRGQCKNYAVVAIAADRPTAQAVPGSVCSNG
jgi:SAM-dependent methyltransferase